MAKSEKIVYYGTGRRKSSIARVRLIEGSGKITINKKDIITGIDRPIKFKEKHELVAKIIQFIKENVFKYQ